MTLIWSSMSKCPGADELVTREGRWRTWTYDLDVCQENATEEYWRKNQELMPMHSLRTGRTAWSAKVTMGWVSETGRYASRTDKDKTESEPPLTPIGPELVRHQEEQPPAALWRNQRASLSCNCARRLIDTMISCLTLVGYQVGVRSDQKEEICYYNSL